VDVTSVASPLQTAIPVRRPARTAASRNVVAPARLAPTRPLERVPYDDVHHTIADSTGGSTA